MHGISSRRPRSVSRGKGRVRLPDRLPLSDWGCCLRCYQDHPLSKSASRYWRVQGSSFTCELSVGR